MNPLMAGYAERHQIALLMCAAVSKRSDMMDERCTNVSPPLFVHVTERMPDQMMVTNPAPHVAIHLLESDDFPIRAEFLAVRAYMQELIDKEQAVGDDLFDLFQ